jgi:hypothetical protein
VPKTLTSNSLADGRFDKQDFVYIAAEDEYRCPAGPRAIKRFTTTDPEQVLVPSAPQVSAESAARRATIGASRAGNMKRCSRRCSSGWIDSEMMRVR